MPLYSYTAAARDGKTVTGTREAETKQALAQLLRKEGVFLLRAEPKQGTEGLSIKKLNINLDGILQRFRPIRAEEKLFFTRNLGVMVSAGLSLSAALTALSKESVNKKLQTIIFEIQSSITRGSTFAQALEKHPTVFPDLYRNMITVGETTGQLSDTLKLLARQMKKDHELARRVRGAMIYPAIIVTALFGIGAFMMLYVVPTLTQTIKELGVDLPLSTRIIIATSDFINNFAILLALLLVAVIALFWRTLKTKAGKAVFDRFILKMPIFGALIEKFNTARFCRTLSYLITAGVPIVRSLEITRNVLGNSLFREAIGDAAKKIQKGTELSSVLSEHANIFQPMVLQMIQVGEETGNLSRMLLRTALFFEEEIADTTKNLSSVIEPILMIIIGSVVGFFAISMLQPIYSSLGNI